MTVSAVAVGAMSMMLFGEFVAQIFVALETGAVENAGHLTIFREGYFKYGTGNPSAYGIKDYEFVLRALAEDPVLKPLINVVTPTVSLYGIAGNFEAEASRTFFGRGVVPADFNRMHLWNEHQLKLSSRLADELLDERDAAHGIVGAGLARILGLCEPLRLSDCLERKGGDRPASPSAVGARASKRDFSALEGREQPPARTDLEWKERAAPRLDLLAATAAGAPNVVNFYVDKAIPQGSKEADDALVYMNFTQAQQLLYGRGERQAVGIVLQLHRTEDIRPARARLERLIKENGWDLEVRELEELQPFYKQAVGMFSAIFSFISLVMAVIVLFTVVNTMSMSVMERTHEIGTLRAMGVKKEGITIQFVLEGAILGLVGATVGLGMGSVLGSVINHSGLTWQPPGNANPIPLTVLTQGVLRLIAGVWTGLVAMATVASWIPARRAARMEIVDALGHI